MHRSRSLALAVTLLVVTGSPPAQVTAPKGYVTTPGDYHTFHLGMFAQGRFQFGDGTLRGASLVVRRVSYRLDQGHVYSASDGTGRSWTNVQLAMAHADVTKMTNAFSTNVLTTSNGAPSNPTRVFNNGVSWPAVKGLVTSATWGKQVVFPFSRAWIYAGAKHDMLFDFQFRGGSLATLGAWAGRLRSFYYLDGVSMGAAVSAPGNWWPGDPFAGGCKDSAHPATAAAAHTGVSAVIHADDHPVPSLRGRATLRLWSYWTAPGQPVLQVLGVGGRPAGVPVGARCNPLFVDLGQPAFYLPRTALGTAAFSGTVTIGPAPYSNVLAGLQLWAQSAWTDSLTSAYSLTAARGIVLPNKPLRLPKKMLHISNVSSLVGTDPVSTPTAQTLPLLSSR